MDHMLIESHERVYRLRMPDIKTFQWTILELNIWLPRRGEQMSNHLKSSFSISWKFLQRTANHSTPDIRRLQQQNKISSLVRFHRLCQIISSTLKFGILCLFDTPRFYESTVVGGGGYGQEM